MSYQVLARKWRPQTFAEVLGQRHISVTLQNAIMRDRVGHAYLFVGPRGIGKTTSARIFAKALNCETPATDAEGRMEPCCVCPTCREIASGNCLDVIEIDGASHNGVDDIRELRETVQYTPTNGRRFKIFIIDEVHMLSTAAWNALLKTLEEPPPHVKFLFATTEAHKVLPTILSRCQRFDLKRIEASTIVARLRDIATREKLFISDSALSVIARAAEGGMRDAQSITDQMIAFCGGMDAASEITEADVIDVFGLASSDELAASVHALLSNDAASLIHSVHHLADRGRNLERLYADLLQFLRDLMVFQLARDPEQILDLTESEQAMLHRLAKQTPQHVVQRLVEGLLEHDAGIRHTLNKRVYIESTLIRVMRDAHALRLDDLMTRLRRLRDGGGLADLDAIDGVDATALRLAGGDADAGSTASTGGMHRSVADDAANDSGVIDRLAATLGEAVAATVNALVPPTTPALAVAGAAMTRSGDAMPQTFERAAAPAPEIVAPRIALPPPTLTPTALPTPIAPEATLPDRYAVLGGEPDIELDPATPEPPPELAPALPIPPVAANFHDPVPGDAGMVTQLAVAPSSAPAPATAPTPTAAAVTPTTEADEADDYDTDERPDDVRFSAAAWSPSSSDDMDDAVPTPGRGSRPAAGGGKAPSGAPRQAKSGGASPDATSDVWGRLERHPFVQSIRDYFGGQLIDVRGGPRENPA